MDTDYSDRRKYPRAAFMSAIEYTLVTEPDFISMKCMTSNVTYADSGFCIYSRGPLHEGQKVLIRKSGLPFGCRKAEVKWAKQINEKVYVAGLRCSVTT